MTPAEARAAARARPSDDQVRGMVLAAVLFLISYEVPTILTEYPGSAGGFSRLVTIDLYDVGLVVLVAVHLPGVIGRLRRHRPGIAVVAAIGLLATTGATLAFSPSWRGLALLVRLVGTAVITSAIAALDRRSLWTYVGAPLVAAAALQGILALGQCLTDGALAVPGAASVFEEIGNTIRPAGTSSHPYMLATYSLVAVSIGMITIRQAASRWWIVGLGLAAMPIGLSFSRAAVAGVAIAGPAWLIAAVRTRSLRRPAAAVMLGIVLPTILFLPAWLERVDDSATTDLNTATTLRVELMERSIEVMRAHPVVGVGPWRYVIDHGEDPDFRLPVHNVPFLLGAEQGITVGVASIVVLIAIGLGAIRSGPLTFALFGSVMGFTLFDVTLYWYPAGLVVLGVWLGTLAATRRDPPGISASRVGGEAYP